MNLGFIGNWRALYAEKYGEPAAEYEFYPDRGWRFDFAFPSERVAVELEGGVYTQGRHTRGQGFIEDCRKYNTATALGWRIIRLPTVLVDEDPILCAEWVAIALEVAKEQRTDQWPWDTYENLAITKLRALG